MKFKVKLKKSARKELENLPQKELPKILQLILDLEDDPRPYGCKKLKAYDNLWRIRSGNYRIIYTIQDNELIIEVLQIVHRKDAY